MKKCFFVILIGISFACYAKTEINTINNKENEYSDELNKYQQEESTNIIFVDSSAIGANNGTSWADAFTSLQSALDAAVSGDTIWIAKGSYYPSSSYNQTNTPRLYHFEMKDSVNIYGGFAGSEDPIVFNLSERDLTNNRTILSGDIGTRGDSTDNCYHVFFHPSVLTASALLDGVSITGGNADGNFPHNNGGGMCNFQCSPTLNNVIISRNAAAYYGGGMYNYQSSSPTLNNVTICRNTGGHGGGISNHQLSSPTLNNVTICENYGFIWGGGIYNYNLSSPTLNNVTIYGNEAHDFGGGIFNRDNCSTTLTNVSIFGNIGDYGGGIYNNSSYLTLTNVKIRENTARVYGGGFCNIFASPTLTNVTISHNSANAGGGIYHKEDTLTINNSIIWDNSASSSGNEFLIINTSTFVTLNYSCYDNNSGDIYNTGTFTATNHNITVNPLFLNSAEGDYRLLGISPCVDAGIDSFNNEVYDIRGIGFGRKLLKTDSSQIGPIDMGAYEYKKGVDPLNFNHKFVDSSATRANNGTNWVDAFTSLQSALDIAISGDTIWVAKGTYYPSSSYGLEIRDGDTTRYYHFEMKEGVKIYGGFIGNENPADFNLSERNFTTNRTIFSGDIGTRGDINDNCYHVFYHPYGLNLTASAILDGVTITGGNANKDEFEYSSNGGGMYNKSSSPILTNVTITGNAAIYYGGGMYNEDNSSTFTNLVISDNTASLGGGIYNTDGCRPTFNNVTITKNVVSNSGGGIFHQYMYSGSSSVFNNSIIWGNTAASRGNDFFIQSDCSILLNYCCYKNNSEDVYNEGSFTANNHNITVDPQFADTDNGDYRLMNTSPCLDAGSDSCNSELYDIRGIGFERKLLKTDTLQAGTIDMGAYEYKNKIDPLNLTYKFVDSSATGANNGTSWADAFTSLQDALDIAISGDKIWVAKGTYYPSSGYNLCDDSGDSTRYYHFEMKEGVKIYGGFAGNENPAVFNLNNRDFITYNTILSGDIGTRGDSTDNCYHIFYHPEGLNLTASALLDGMTITGGNADGDYPHAEGGGMFNNFNSPTLKNVSIMRNRADEGGGIYNSEETSPTLTNVTISENTAKFTGGGIYNTSASSPTLTNVIISNNRAGTSGGGMLNYTLSSPTLTNVTISKNSAEMSGGGMYNHWYSSPTLTNVVINGNKANHYGGGIYNDFYASPTFTNVTICKNTAEEKGGGIYNERSSSTFNNSILWENTAYNGNEFYIDDLSSALLNYCCYNNAAGDIYNEGSFTATNHNITLNPRFANLTNSDYRLCSTSPCLDAGNDSCNSELYDIRGIGYGRKLLKTDSLQAGTIDMGAYEYKNDFDLVKYNMILYVDSSASGTNNGSSWINAFTSLQSALETAISGYTIWVAKGTYYPSSGYNLCDDSGDSTRYYHFEMKEGVKIYGSFAGYEDPEDFNPSKRDFTTDRTILSGDIGTRGNNTDNCYHVFYHPEGLNLTDSALLDGMNITGGNADADGVDNYAGGGGMYNKSNSPTLTNVTICKNSSKGGGGIYNFSYSSPILNNVTISENISIGFGGGMYNYLSSSPILTNVTISGNSARLSGGGMFNYSSSSPTLTNVIVSGNTSTSGGGGIMNYTSSSPILNNVTISGNRADEGGGIYIFGSSSSILNNSIIWGNSASTSGNEFYIESGSTVILNYSCYKDNSEDVFNEGTFTDTTHNISIDPQFADTVIGDYRLMSTSPCLDAGNDSYNSELYDIRGIGFERKLLKTGFSQIGTIDMGAYENKRHNMIIFVDSSIADGENDGTSWADAFTSMQSALDIAISGDTIWIAKGTYYPSSGYDLCDDSGDSTRYYHFRMKEDVKIYGGFAGNEDPAVFNLNDRDLITNNTILSGDIGTRGDSTDNCYHVFYHPKELNLSASALLDGVSITGGNADGDYPHYNGGGMYNYSSSPTLTNVKINLNTAYFGGGMYNYSSSPTLTNININLNTAPYDGGGMYNFNNSSPTLNNVNINLNTAKNKGGGMCNDYSSSPILTNVDIIENTANYDGGGNVQ